ncbi:MAG: hypothetical protein AB1664_00700 [Thermodesulfobacteriota bacterium]
MKKLLLTVMVLALVLPLTSFAAAPVFQTYVSITPDTIVVDSQWTGNWEPVDSLVIARTDSGGFLITVTGMVQLDPYDVLYIGLGNDSANRVSAATAATTGQTNTNLDTAVFFGPGYRNRPAWSAFVLQYYYEGNGALTDTVYVNAACAGSGQPVRIEDLVVSAAVTDKQ